MQFLRIVMKQNFTKDGEDPRGKHWHFESKLMWGYNCSISIVSLGKQQFVEEVKQHLHILGGINVTAKRKPIGTLGSQNLLVSYLYWGKWAKLSAKWGNHNLEWHGTAK